MNCLGVGELMQRNLDNDLNEQELTILMNHVSECEDCSQLFEKLVLLSGSLEQLPRVTPSISIVDAILPELEQIDQQKATEQQVVLRKKNLRARWYTGFGSIAAAALVIVTMVSLNGLPSQDDSTIALNETAQRSLFKQSANMNTSANDTHMPSTVDYNELVKSTAKTDDNMSESYEGVISQFGARKDTSSQLEEESVELPDASLNASASDQSGSQMERETTNFTQQERSNAELDQLTAVNVNEDQSTVTDEVPELDLTQNQIKSGALMSASLQNYSKDEQVYLVFEEHTISVYEASTGEVVKQWNKVLEGEYQFDQWADDNSYFTYTVIDSNGVPHSYSKRLDEKE